MIQALASLATVAIVLGPLLPIIYQSFVDRPLYESGQNLTTVNYQDLLSDPEFMKVIWNSLVFAGGSTLIAQGVGVALAILVGRTNIPFRSFLNSVILLPLFVSHLLLTLGWFILYGPAGFVTLLISTNIGSSPWDLYSMGGMCLLAGIAHAPLTILYCLASTALADPRMEDAARSCGASPLRTLRSVTLPLLIPSILYSGVLNFTGALEMLSVPLIFGEPVGIRLLMTHIYSEAFASIKPNYGLVGACAVILMLILIALLWLQRYVLGDARRFNTVGGKASRPRMIDLGPLRWPAFLLVLAYCVLLIVLPLLAVALRAIVPFLSPLVPFWQFLTMENFVAVFSTPANARSVFNTILVAGIAAVLGTGLSFLVSIVTSRSNFPGRGVVEYIALLPRAIPGMVAGTGVLYLMLFVPQVGWLRNTIWILIIAYVARALPIGVGAISPSLMQIAPDLDRAARVSGATWWQTSQRILLGLVTPALFSSFVLLFISFTKEYTTAIFLIAPGSEVLGVSILQAWAQGDIAKAAALATIQIILLLVFLFIARRLLGVRVHG